MFHQPGTKRFQIGGLATPSLYRLGDGQRNMNTVDGTGVIPRKRDSRRQGGGVHLFHRQLRREGTLDFQVGGRPPGTGIQSPGTVTTGQAGQSIVDAEPMFVESVAADGETAKL